ncbi:methionyl-tRNA formyltransferase [Mycoplasmopsis californica]|uniref:Methionyl-tRNA formyltransferase n=1 Tax=Mycoplasmopsis equigenitalium TaxID=114883 RepID=A0ABY5J212_9BACT|nr:methionyl-tRNA formyltransferase [Mycoplasmopsis equigenitalium]UUD36759.1 methionyl-tRNA formyltransferase [Mycoplasmopsis equigenitalium]VEU69946.1 methionyl-tRNA formyltransferase [Mycoplasmopsis californica]
MKIVLCGTPAFILPVFAEIATKNEIVAVITQPDAKANRGQKIQENKVAAFAKNNNFLLFQPEKINDIFNQLFALEFDILLTYAFGQFIPTRILNLPKIAAINIHGSLLPKYRGAAPIQHALLNGDKETGISLIYMTKIMDAGDIIFSAKMPINPEDTTSILFNKITELALKNINYWLLKIKRNDIASVAQDESLVTFAHKLEKQDGELDKNRSIKDNINLIRAYADNPGAFTFINDKRVKVFRAQKEMVKNAPFIQVADGNLYFTKYQFESKKIVDLKN